MSTITKEFTKEQLIEKLKHRISVASEFPESEKAKIDLELARIALASLESESAQVVPEEMTPQQASRSYGGEVRGYRDGWNDCRAAMLQSGNFRENKNSSTNYPVIPSEALSAILKVAKIRADFDDFDGDRRGIGDCLDDAEQELIVTINKYASQLAAEPIATNDVREQTAVPPVPVIQADVAQAIEKLKRKLVECNRYNYCADAVKGVEYACHAAMLQAGNHNEQHLDMVVHSGADNGKANCGLPFAQWLSQQNEPIDVDCGCVTTEVFYHWLRVAYETANSPVAPDCSCRTCRPVTFTDSRFVVCPECGNKRCPHANDHRNACTGSNEPGQEGSAYQAAPQQEVK